LAASRLSRLLIFVTIVARAARPALSTVMSTFPP
jgi:hypothetical protein